LKGLAKDPAFIVGGMTRNPKNSRLRRTDGNVKKKVEKNGKPLKRCVRP